eukprot:5712202-Amphidinium_carterae.1
MVTMHVRQGRGAYKSSHKSWHKSNHATALGIECIKSFCGVAKSCTFHFPCVSQLHSCLDTLHATMLSLSVLPVAGWLTWLVRVSARNFKAVRSWSDIKPG